MFERVLEVDAVFDQVGPEAAHRRVLLGTVAVRHDDGDRHTGRPTRERDALAVVASGCGDDTANGWPFSDQAIDVHQSAAHLEGTSRRAVLVLQPHLRTDVPAEQWPGELRCRRHVVGHHFGRVDELVVGEERHAEITASTRTSCAASGISSTS